MDFLKGKAWVVRILGPLKPKYKILGFDIAGRVETVDRNVKQYHPGDEIFGDLFSYGFGGFAEYVCAPEKALVLKSVRSRIRADRDKLNNAYRWSDVKYLFISDCVPVLILVRGNGYIGYLLIG